MSQAEDVAHTESAGTRDSVQDPGSVNLPRAASPWSAFTIGAGSAQLMAWSVLALLNAALILVLLPWVEPRTQLLHHAYDAGHLLAVGVLSLALVQLAELTLSRLPRRLRRGWVRVLLLGAAVFAVSMGIVDEDISNLAERYEVRMALVRIAASLAFAVALTSTLLLRRIALAVDGALGVGRAFGPGRVVLFGGGVAAAVGNAFVLELDYSAIHLMVAGFGALLIGHALEGCRVRGPSRAARRVGLGVLAAAALAALLVQPRSGILRRLYSLSTSVVAPIAARYWSVERGIELEKVPAQYVSSPWFHDRAQQPPVPSSGAFTPPGRRIVLYFTIEAMRADVLEKKKYRGYLPELHELRSTSAYFTLARAATPGTTTSMASVFRSRYYSQLRWSALGDSRVTLEDDAPSFPALLSKAGIRTVHAATQGRLTIRRGVGVGFQHEHYIPDGKNRGARAIDKLIEELDQHPESSFFGYAHFVESHAPYNLAGTDGSPFDCYVREIGIADREIGRIRQHIDEKGLTPNTVIIISGDHGEAFGEHGVYYHSQNVYEEAMRVGLILHIPGQKRRKSGEAVTLVDLGPTVLDLFGVDTPGTYMGQSLVPLATGAAKKLDRPVAVDTGRRVQVLYLRDGKKAVLDLKRHTVEVYDLKRDPGELTNLVDRGVPGVEAAIETAKLFFEVHRRKDLGYEPPWQKF